MKEKIKVLHLEDNPNDAELVKEILLESSDIEVSVVENRDDFIDSLRKREFDIVLADYNLPNFDGIQALEIVKSIQPELPFIFLSGTIGEERAVECLKLGAMDVVLKHNLNNLVPAVNRALLLVKEMNQRKISEEKVAQNERFLSTLFNTIGDIIVTLSVPECIIQYANKAITELLGYSVEEMIGTNIGNLFPNEEACSKFSKKLIEASQNGKIPIIDELILVSKNGKQIYFDAKISFLEEKPGVFSAIAVLRDLTEKKQLISDLMIAKEKAEESSKLKTAILMNMSHEIRTPLNGILGFAQILTSSRLPQEKINEYSAFIYDSGQRLLRLFDNIMSLSRIETGTEEVIPIKFDVSTLLYDIYEQHFHEAQNKGIDIHIVLPADSQYYSITSDRVKIEQILTNLLDNAIKFTERGSIEIGYSVLPDSIQFFVKDTGIGIPQQYLQSIFDRFIQVDMSLSRGYEGAGLGLSICKALAELLGGNIYVESEPGKGSIFYFTLPVQVELTD